MCSEREFIIDKILARIHFIVVMIRWTGLAPWAFEFSVPGSLTSTFLVVCSHYFALKVPRGFANGHVIKFCKPFFSKWFDPCHPLQVSIV